MDDSLAGKRVVHMAPPAKQAPNLMGNLLEWFKTIEHHPLSTSSAFHFEFEFIHPFSDGNGRMGRLWQTCILCRWNPLFAQIPVERIVYAHQQEYYQALQAGTREAESSPFMEFMLTMIHKAVLEYATPQVRQLLQVIKGEMTREELQVALGLSDRKSFRQRYLAPALSEGFIKMTLPGKPNSRLQRYRLTDKGLRLVKSE